LVVGSPNSSNSNRLVEVAQRSGVKAQLIDSAKDIDVKWLEGVSRVGLTAGASAPEVLVEQVSERLAEFGFTDQRDLDLIREDVRSRCRRNWRPSLRRRAARNFAVCRTQAGETPSKSGVNFQARALHDSAIGTLAQ